MKIKIKEYESQSSLISSILFFIMGGILFSQADKLLNVLSIGIGIIVAIMGIIILTIYSFNKEENRTSLASGIVLLLIAFIFICFHNIVEQFIRFIIGGWILFTGIIRLINALSINFKDRKFLPLLLVSVCLIGIGIYTIVKGNIILSSVGLIMMIYAAIEIIGFIFYSKNKEETTISTSVIINDEPIKEEKTKKVKDVKIKEEKKKRKKTNKEKNEE